MTSRIGLEREEVSFNIIGYVVITGIAVAALLPFLLIVSGSVTAEEEIHRIGYRLIPTRVSLAAYRAIFTNAATVSRAYTVTIVVTALGTTISLAASSMAAYVLSMKAFAPRNRFAFFFYFAAIFSGGLVPRYIWIVRYLGLKNTLWGLILPGMIVPFSIFLLRNFMTAIHDSIRESAVMDGARPFAIYLRIYLPLTVPALVTVGLFRALYYWNDWMQARLYITQSELYPMQYYLYNLLSMSESIQSIAAEAGIPLPDYPAESIKLAMAVVATGPIVFLYPFVQRFYIKGITIGAVKG